MALKPPASLAGCIVPIVLAYWPQVTVDIADAGVKAKCPFKGTVLGVTARARALGGTPHTDVDLQIMKNTTELVAALPVVDASALTAGGTQGTLALSGADLNVAEDDFFHLKLINIAGGSSPTLDGLEVTVWVLTR